MNKVITIHQPEHIPWLGFFNKVDKVDAYVVLDNVQFRKRYFQNRNKIRTRDGWHWITVPVIAKNNSIINDVVIDNSGHWMRKYLETIRHTYHNAPFYNDYYDCMAQIIKEETEYISELNYKLIRFLMNALGINTKIIRISELDLPSDIHSSNLILEICKSLNASVYMSGKYGVNYLNEKDFEKENIKMLYQDFHHPIYKQLYEPFIPQMSIIDLLFNHGPVSLNIIRENNK